MYFLMIQFAICVMSFAGLGQPAPNVATNGEEKTAKSKKLHKEKAKTSN